MVDVAADMTDGLSIEHVMRNQSGSSFNLSLAASVGGNLKCGRAEYCTVLAGGLTVYTLKSFVDAIQIK